MTLEDYLRDNIKKNVIDFKLRAQFGENGMVSFYIHPDSKDGDTLDYYVFDDDLMNKPLYDNAKEETGKNLIKKMIAMNEIKKKLHDAQKQHNE